MAESQKTWHLGVDETFEHKDEYQLSNLFSSAEQQLDLKSHERFTLKRKMSELIGPLIPLWQVCKEMQEGVNLSLYVFAHLYNTGHEPKPHNGFNKTYLTGHMTKQNL